MGNVWTTPLATPIFYMYGNKLLVKLVYVKVLKEGESMYRVVAFLHLIDAYFSFLLL